MGVLLKSTIKMFSIYQLLMVIWHIALTATAFGVSIYIFDISQNNVADLTQSMLMGRKIVELSTYVRYLNIYSLVDDTKNFDGSLKKLNSTIISLESGGLSYLRNRMASLSDYDSVVTIRPPSVMPTIEMMNAYQMLSALVDYAIDLSYENMTYFKTVEDYRFDFIIRNLGPIRDRLFIVWDNGQAEYKGKINAGVMILIACIALAGATVFVWFGIFYPVLRKTAADQARYLKIFGAIPKRDLLNMITDIDEAIEEIQEDMMTSEDNDAADNHVNVKTLMDRNDVKDKQIKVLLWKYMTSVVLLALCVAGMLTIPLVRVSLADATVDIITYVGRERPHVASINFYATEACRMEHRYWHTREPETQMQYFLTLLEALHRNAVTGVGKKKITPLSSIPELRTILTNFGNCKRVNPQDCDPATRDPPYVPGVGYTYDLVVNSVDNLMSRLIAESQMFLEDRYQMPETQAGTANLTDFLENPHLILMRGIMNDVVEGLQQTQSILFELINSQNAQAEKQVIGLMCMTIALAFLLYIFVFLRFTRQRSIQADQVVNLVFMIPQTVIDAKQDLKRFIESGGLSTLEDV
ncbi:hypothetical protein HK102_007459 [Quaeritorhiza haematococci]|nr:hypothetical protein HK102_007459 [Quaeritorhiza haematococci]